MSQGEITRFSCASCGKSYAWKPQLAGKKAKCKCGAMISVPAGPAKQAEDELYDLVPDDASSMPPVSFSKSSSAPAPAAAAPSRGTSIAAARAASGGGSAAPAGVAGVKKTSRGTIAPAAAFPGGVLGYKQPIPSVKDRFSQANLMDMKRDVHVPAALIIAGFVIYIAYYMLRYEMAGSGIAIVTAGLGIMMAFKAALLIGFAFAVAGPLGVSFGGIWTAVLKLAAVAIFADGCTTWVDYGIDKLTGVGGGFGYMVSFPIALGIYWVLLTYLFSMDAGDAWLVVILLAVFSMIVRWALLVLLVTVILNWGGVDSPALAFGGGGAAAAGPHAESVEYVQDLKTKGMLNEAKEYTAAGGERAITNHVNDWYDAGAKNVWVVVSRNFDGSRSAQEVIVELPKDKAQRAACYKIIADYYNTMGWGQPSPDMLADDGAPYLFLGL